MKSAALAPVQAAESNDSDDNDNDVQADSESVTAMQSVPPGADTSAAAAKTTTKKVTFAAATEPNSTNMRLHTNTFALLPHQKNN